MTIVEQDEREQAAIRALSGIANPEAWVRSVREALHEIKTFGPSNLTIIAALRAVERAERGET